jgi:hypothetical protein
MSLKIIREGLKRLSEDTVNPLERYEEWGTKAGRASKNYDRGMVSHCQEMLRKLLAMETSPEGKQAGRKAFDNAFFNQSAPDRPSFMPVLKGRYSLR